jgi:toxin ParE1/3/4
MTETGTTWRVRLTAAAQTDFQSILRWTTARFGPVKARAYADTLSAALGALTAGPTIAGSRKRDDIANGLFTLHVARNGRKGRHFILFRIGGDDGKQWIEVLRLLHDAMDLQRHLPPSAPQIAPDAS